VPDALDLQYGQEINVFPNPASDFLNIKLREESSVKLIDIKGNVVFFSGIFLDGSVDVSNLTPGVYLLDVITKEKIVQRMIVIQ
jgi:hypothetical protein